jgi:DNA polymerase-4
MPAGASPPDGSDTAPAAATILHVDLDAFYAAVEVLLDPSLRGRPLIVGGSGRRGVVASCSYEARAYGIRSAMPSGQARRLCPHAVFVSGNYDRYSEYSRRLHGVFASFTPLVEPIALDEAFLDVGGAVRLFGPGEVIGAEIRRRVLDELGLSASVGVATSKLVAKLASEAAKPKATLSGIVPGAGVVVVRPGEELGFLHPKPVEVLWGVGPATSVRLRRLGVTTIGDLAAVPLEALVVALGDANGRHLHDLAWGRDHRPVEADRPTKSIGHEETYAHDKDDRDELHREVVRMADAVAARLRANGLAGRTVVLKVRFGDFATITRSQTLPGAVDTGPVIARVAATLLDQVDISAGVRLLGLSASNLVRGAARQLSLDMSGPTHGTADGTADGSEPPAAAWRPSRDEPAGAGWDNASRAVDEVRLRFGDGAVGPAILLDERGLKIKRQGDTQWGPDGGSPGGSRPAGGGSRGDRDSGDGAPEPGEEI